MSSKQAPLSNIKPPARDLLRVSNALGETGIPEKYREKPFYKNRSSLKQTIPASAWQDANIPLNNPGTITHYYYADSKVLLSDLGGTGFDINAVRNALGDTDIPEKFGGMSLCKEHKSIAQTIPSDAWRHAGIDLNDPEPVTHYYLEKSEILLIDLGGRFNDD